MIKGELLLVSAIIGLIILLNIVLSDNTLEQAQAGVITLQCHMKDGVRVIDPGKVVGLVDGVWVFENGSAKSCEVIKRGDL